MKKMLNYLKKLNNNLLLTYNLLYEFFKEISFLYRCYLVQKIIIKNINRVIER